MKNDMCSAEWNVWERLREWRRCGRRMGMQAASRVTINKHDVVYAACIARVVPSPMHCNVPSISTLCEDGANPIRPMHTILDATYGTLCDEKRLILVWVCWILRSRNRIIWGTNSLGCFVGFSHCSLVHLCDQLVVHASCSIGCRDYTGTVRALHMVLYVYGRV